MKNMNLILGFSLMIGLASYSTALDKSDYDREVNFASFKTFDWKAHPDKAGDNPFAQNTLLEKRIHRAVEQRLEAKGYQRRTTGDADFYIVYSVSIEDRVDARPYGYGYLGSYYSPYRYGHHGHGGHSSFRFGFGHHGHGGYGRHGYGSYGYRGYGRYGYPGYGGYGYRGYGGYAYQEATLSLDFVDAESNELLWRGWYVGKIRDGQLSEKKINKAVKRIIKKFPPR